MADLLRGRRPGGGTSVTRHHHTATTPTTGQLVPIMLLQHMVSGDGLHRKSPLRYGGLFVRDGW